MDASYGVGITNRYALFIGEEDIDPFEVLKTPAQEKDKKIEVKKVEKKDVKAKPTEQKPQGKAPAAAGKPISEVQNKRTDSKTGDKPERQGGPPGQENRPPRGRGRGTGPRFGGDRDREERNNRRNEEGREDRPREYRERPAGGDESEGGNFGSGEGFRGRFRGGPRGGGFSRGRGGRGGRPQDMRPRRDFERQSGSDKTGVKPMEKKDGAGSHNWGSVIDDIEGQLETTPENVWGEPAAEVEPTEAPIVFEPPPETDESAAEEPAAPEGPRELTLDEWKALRGQRKKPEYNLRKPGEGEDGGQWKKAVELKKKEELEEEEEEEDYSAEYLQRAGRQKHIEIDIRFADSRRGGPGRGGPRGRGRGGAPRGESDRPEEPREFDEKPRAEVRGGRGGRGGFRGEGRGNFRGGRGGPRTNGHAAPRVDDESDFPALM